MNIDVYVDGSYYKKTPKVTYGGVVVVQDKNTPKEIIHGVRHVKTEKSEFVSANNAGGELIAALVGIIDACQVLSCVDGKHMVNIYYDYKGVKEFLNGGEYQARKAGPQFYVGAVESVKKVNPNVELKFHKVIAHTGDKFNELADTIAKGVVPTMYQKYQKETLNI